MSKIASHNKGDRMRAKFLNRLNMAGPDAATKNKDLASSRGGSMQSGKQRRNVCIFSIILQVVYTVYIY